MTGPERSDAELIAVCVEIGLPNPDVDTDTDGATNFYFKDGDRAALATRTSNGRLKVLFETGVERWRATYSIDSAVWRWHLAKFFGQDEQLIASQAAEIARLTERAEFAENQMGERIAAVERAGASRMRERAAQVARDLGAFGNGRAIATAIAALPLGEK